MYNSCIIKTMKGTETKKNKKEEKMEKKDYVWNCEITCNGSLDFKEELTAESLQAICRYAKYRFELEKKQKKTKEKKNETFN